MLNRKPWDGCSLQKVQAASHKAAACLFSADHPSNVWVWLSNACFVFSLFLYSSYQDCWFNDFFLKVQIVRVVCIHNLNMCCWKNFTMSLKSIKIIKCLAGTASTCSMLFCQSPGCSRSFWAQSKLHNASFRGKLFTLWAVSHSLLSPTTLQKAGEAR